jgi:hypothetical protein
LRREGEHRCERADDVLVGDLEGADGAATEAGLLLVQVVAPDVTHARVAVALGALANLRQASKLLLVPRDEQRSRSLERDADLVRIRGEQRVAACDEAGLDGPRLGVVGRVQDRRVRLACAGSNVSPCFEQRDLKLEVGQLACDRRSDVPGANDCDVVVRGAHPR